MPKLAISQVSFHLLINNHIIELDDDLDITGLAVVVGSLI